MLAHLAYFFLLPIYSFTLAVHSTFSRFFVKESRRRRFRFVLFDFLFYAFYILYFLAYFFKYFLVHKFLCASQKILTECHFHSHSQCKLGIICSCVQLRWAFFRYLHFNVPLWLHLQRQQRQRVPHNQCKHDCVVARFSGKAKKAPGFSMVSLVSL